MFATKLELVKNSHLKSENTNIENARKKTKCRILRSSIIKNVNWKGTFFSSLFSSAELNSASQKNWGHFLVKKCSDQLP